MIIQRTITVTYDDMADTVSVHSRFDSAFVADEAGLGPKVGVWRRRDVNLIDTLRTCAITCARDIAEVNALPRSV